MFPANKNTERSIPNHPLIKQLKLGSILLLPNFLFLSLQRLGGAIPRPKKRSALYPFLRNRQFQVRRMKNYGSPSCMLNVRIRHLRQYVRDIHGVGDSFIFISDKVFGDTRRKMNKDIIPTLFRVPILTPV